MSYLDLKEQEKGYGVNEKDYSELSDEALGLLWIKHENDQGHHITALYKKLADEFYRRYKNKKKECEAMRKNQERWTNNVLERLKKIEDLAGMSNFRLSSET